MTKKNDDKKIGGIKSTTHAKGVESTEAVSGVSGVKATSAVGGVRGAAGIDRRKTTRLMSLAEREQLLRIVDEEAAKLFGQSDGKKTVQSAVKMAIDAGLLTEDDPAKKKK